MTQLTARRPRGIALDARLTTFILLIAIGTGAGFLLGHLSAPSAAGGRASTATTPLEDLPGWLEYRSGERADLAAPPLAISLRGPFEASRGASAAWTAWLDYRSGERQALTPSPARAP